MELDQLRAIVRQLKDVMTARDTIEADLQALTDELDTLVIWTLVIWVDELLRSEEMVEE